MARTVGRSAVQPDVHYTVADYKTWPDNERWELINGIAYSMSPAPQSEHQRQVGELFFQIWKFLDGKVCEPFLSPIDVFLPILNQESDEETTTVVQPDILVVCDPQKVVKDGIRGVPDFVVEILSDPTAYKDLNKKRPLRNPWRFRVLDRQTQRWKCFGLAMARGAFRSRERVPP